MGKKQKFTVLANYNDPTYSGIREVGQEVELDPDAEHTKYALEQGHLGSADEGKKRASAKEKREAEAAKVEAVDPKAAEAGAKLASTAVSTGPGSQPDDATSLHVPLD